MIAEVLFWVSVVGIITTAIFFDEEDWSIWVMCICAMVAISCIFFGMVQDEKKPIKVHTKQQPQIDTIIEIRNSIPDTSYVYIFYKENKK